MRELSNRLRLFRYWALFLGAGWLAGCGGKPTKLASAGKGTPHYEVAEALTDVWHSQLPGRWAIDTLGAGSIDNLAQLVRGEVDYALVQNDATLRSPSLRKKMEEAKLRTVLPLYQQVFFLIYNPSIEAETLNELVAGRRVNVGPRGSGTAYLTKKLFQSQGIDTTTFAWQYSSYAANAINDSVDISVSVTTPYNPRIARMVTNGAKIWSLDDPANLGRGCTSEAFCQVYPMARPEIIPRYRYPNLEKPVLTIAVDNVLLTRAETSEMEVFDLVETTLAHRRELGERSPLFLGLSETVDESRLHYPLHAGTLNYLERNKPSFLERNADLISLLITFGSVGYGAILLVARRRREQARAHIETLYQEVLMLEENLPTYQATEQCTAALERLHAIRLEAIKALARKKLEPDTGFRILLDLIDQAQQAVFERQRQLSYSKRYVSTPSPNP